MEKNQTFEELKLTVPWGHISAKAWGSRYDKKILAVHGLLDNAGSFDRIIKFLPAGFYIVCIDLPGHGFSSYFNPGVPLNFLSYVLTIHHVLSALQWTSCIYMGHSFGGHIGTMYSILYPERIEKIILLDAFISIPTSNKDLISNMKNVCNVAITANMDKTKRFYTKEEILYALAYKRFSTLNVKAAEALFQRAVTKVNNLYKYNRDFRLSAQVLPFYNVNQLLECLKNFSTPCIIVLASSTLEVYIKNWFLHIVEKTEAKLSDKITLYRAVGNHDVHNNYPERVAPYICEFLNSNIKSKL